MPESVATTTNFNLPVDEIIQEAIDTLGGESQSGYDTLSAIRSLNLLMIDLANRGYPLASLEKRSLSLVSGTNEYALGNDVLMVLDANLKEGDQETPLSPIAFLEYFNISDKSQEGRVSTYCYDRTGSTFKLFVYPTPDSSTPTIEYWVVRRHKDINALYQLVDMQSRYLPALTMGLAYFMAFKKPGVSPDYVTMLKTEYLERLDNAFVEDRDHYDFMIYPSLPSGRR